MDVHGFPEQNILTKPGNVDWMLSTLWFAYLHPLLHKFIELGCHVGANTEVQFGCKGDFRA